MKIEHSHISRIIITRGALIFAFLFFSLCFSFPFLSSFFPLYLRSPSPQSLLSFWVSCLPLQHSWRWWLSFFFTSATNCLWRVLTICHISVAVRTTSKVHNKLTDLSHWLHKCLYDDVYLFSFGLKLISLDVARNSVHATALITNSLSVYIFKERLKNWGDGIKCKKRRKKKMIVNIWKSIKDLVCNMWWHPVAQIANCNQKTQVVC